VGVQVDETLRQRARLPCGSGLHRCDSV